jgi:hypothetical protein
MIPKTVGVIFSSKRENKGGNAELIPKGLLIESLLFPAIFSDYPRPSKHISGQT